MDPYVPCKTGQRDHVFRKGSTFCVFCFYNCEPKYSPEIEKAIRKHKRRRASRMSLYKRVVLTWGVECVFCGDIAETADHLIPSSRGGSSSMLNLRPCCVICNQAKADYTPFEWLKERCPEEFRHLKAPYDRRNGQPRKKKKSSRNRRKARAG